MYASFFLFFFLYLHLFSALRPSTFLRDIDTVAYKSINLTFTSHIWLLEAICSKLPAQARTPKASYPGPHPGCFASPPLPPQRILKWFGLDGTLEIIQIIMGGDAAHQIRLAQGLIQLGLVQLQSIYSFSGQPVLEPHFLLSEVFTPHI